jgi:1-acyl-sn-glycerol-3-phosphate acyltransferase
MYQNYREIPSPLQAVWDILDNHLATTPSAIRMVFRCIGFLGVTIVLIGPFAFFALVQRGKPKRFVAKIWFAACRKITGLKVTVHGNPVEVPGTLYIANHVSYLDIIVLGHLIDARFVAKSDVAGWPLFGLLARLSNTLFVTRDRRKSVQDSEQIQAAISAGDQLIMFPEGTSSNGRTVLPFKSSLFAGVDPGRVPTNVQLQPISIAYTNYAEGRALKGPLTDLYAWYGDMTLFGHLMTVFGLKGASVEIRLQPPIHPWAFTDRKQLTSASEHAVRTGLATSFR